MILNQITTKCLHKSANNLIRKKIAVQGATRCLSFSYAGPRSLDEILKLDLIADKSSEEVSAMWEAYHANKENVFGKVLGGNDGKLILERAKTCSFFIQPLFRDDGFIMLLSQFQEPCHFMMASLEDYKNDPSKTQPVLTFSVFNDLAERLDLSMVRCDVISKVVEDAEGVKILDQILNSYAIEQDFHAVHTFNHEPGSFDVDDYIAQRSRMWKEQDLK
mmetsp:Transcript_21698/g.33123  ORF Transcript_21698/g.33123 Transcript_21698/m.33123 type:complete len:219 (+) Transcript_21698:28-684(+)